MKSKGITFSVLLLIASLLLTGCSPLAADIPQKKTIYATFYPIYALADALCAEIDNVELHCLVQPQDGCLRSYELSDWDLYMLAYSANAVLSAGSGLESFSAQLQTLGETALPLAEVMHGLNLFQSEAAGEDESHFTGANPHLYMSIDGAEALLESIATALMVFDEEHTDIYEANYANICAELSNLKQQLKKETVVCSGIPAAILNEALFYTATDCSLEIAGYYERESSEMLYGNNLQNCLETLKEMGAKVVLLENQAPQALIQALESAGFAVAQLNTMSTLSENDAAAGYFDALKQNAVSVAAACRTITEQQEEF